MSEQVECKYCGRVIVFYNPMKQSGFGIWIHKSTHEEECHPIATPALLAAQPVGTAKPEKDGEK